ncbi:MAG: potassium channel family protein [Candidatus Saccharimonadia bacterium]
MSERANRGLWWIGLSVLGLLFFGTVGLSHTASLSIGNAIYESTYIMLSHNDHFGFVNSSSRLIEITLDISSYVVVAYLLKWFAEYIIGIGDNVKKRRMKAKVERLREHYIVCGLGRVGSQVARELHHEGIAYVGLDKDPEKVEEAIKNGLTSLVADSTLEESLQDAGVAHAKGLIACLGEDSLNLFVVLAARSINPKLYIVARANRSDNQVKLKRAGADKVAMPYQIGGYHMANMALRPNVVDFMDIVSTNKKQSDLAVEEMVVGEHSKLAGHRLGRALIDSQVKGATVIAINGVDGTSRIEPNGHETIYAGDRLIVLGARKDLTEASSLIR